MTKSKLLTYMRIWIGLWLFIPGVLKVIDLTGFAGIVDSNWSAVLPGILIPPMKYALPFIEIVVGLSVTFGLYIVYSSAMYLGMHVVFVALNIYVLGAGIPLNDCGCFGTIVKNPASIGGLGKDLTFLFLSVLIFISYSQMRKDEKK